MPSILKAAGILVLPLTPAAFKIGETSILVPYFLLYALTQDEIVLLAQTEEHRKLTSFCISDASILATTLGSRFEIIPSMFCNLVISIVEASFGAI